MGVCRHLECVYSGCMRECEVACVFVSSGLDYQSSTASLTTGAVGTDYFLFAVLGNES